MRYFLAFGWGVTVYLTVGSVLEHDPRRRCWSASSRRKKIRDMETRDLYTGATRKKKDRSIEHVMPISFLRKGHQWDVLNLAVTHSRLNNWRQARLFIDQDLKKTSMEILVLDQQTCGRDDRHFVPPDLAERGRIARICLYMIHYYPYLYPLFSEQQYQTLHEWCDQYPLSLDELRGLIRRLLVFV